VRIELGNDIEEAHMRNRALIANWVLDHAEIEKDGATCCVAEIVEHDGKHYIQINDYEALRGLFAKLLAEIQRIKSEGDYEAARYLVEKYAIKLDADLHKEIKERYARLNIAPYKGFINPWMKPVVDAEGNITDIELDYTESFEHQNLRYKDLSPRSPLQGESLANAR
jgi:dipeptidyl-peptidase-3